MHYQTLSKVIVIVLLFTHIYCIELRGEDGTGTERIFEFAESLFEEGDYFRSISEYKRFIFYYPNHNLADKATFRIAESYLRTKRWSEAIESCSQFLARYSGGPLYYEFLYLKGRAEKQDKRFNDAIRTFDIIEKSNLQNYSDKAIYQKALIMLERSDWQGTKDFLTLVPYGSALFSTAESFKAELARIDQLPRKSPATAGLLAAILPGAGHLYTERPKDALTSFLLNGAFIWAAVELFHHENYAAGGIVAIFELGWYSGNIYSAVSSAHKYNRKQEEDLIKNLKDKFSLAFYHDREVSSILLSRSF